jgi:hypothetical protein
MTKKRVTIKKIDNGYLINYGGKTKDIAQNKPDADIRADKLRNKLKRTGRR